MQKLAKLAGFPTGEWSKTLPKRCLIDRDAAIIEECRGRSVLHVGAADAPFEIEKGRSGELLHQKIQKVASKLIGIDVDVEAIAALGELGVNDIILGDITTDGGVLEGETFDVVLCCDVIEHVSSAGDLLVACRRFMRPDSKLMVTTINATALKPALRALGGREAVHHDHVAYYSFSTLGKLLTLNKLRPVEFGVFAYPTVNPIVGWLLRSVMSAAPGCADGIMINARLA